jgi:hypothetical protein
VIGIAVVSISILTTQVKVLRISLPPFEIRGYTHIQNIGACLAVNSQVGGEFDAICQLSFNVLLLSARNEALGKAEQQTCGARLAASAEFGLTDYLDATQPIRSPQSATHPIAACSVTVKSVSGGVCPAQCPVHAASLQKQGWVSSLRPAKNPAKR